MKLSFVERIRYILLFFFLRQVDYFTFDERGSNHERGKQWNSETVKRSTPNDLALMFREY